MEFEDLSEKMKWGARRAAVAFNLKKAQWDEMDTDEDGTNFRFHSNAFFVCSFDATGELNFFCIGPPNKDNTNNWKDNPCRVGLFDGVWKQYGVAYKDWMVRGLYRVGFEDEEILRQLPPLSAHEKLELRLSIPREFWSQKWRDEMESGVCHNYQHGSEG